MVPAHRMTELEQNDLGAATAVACGVQTPEIVTTDGSEETLFDMYEDVRDYDLGEGD
jgi:hypothetical protein